MILCYLVLKIYVEFMWYELDVEIICVGVYVILCEEYWFMFVDVL